MRTINLITKEDYADSVVDYRNPGVALPLADSLTEGLRSGARKGKRKVGSMEKAAFVKNLRAAISVITKEGQNATKSCVAKRLFPRNSHSVRELNRKMERYELNLDGFMPN